MKETPAYTELMQMETGNKQREQCTSQFLTEALRVSWPVRACRSVISWCSYPRPSWLSTLVSGTPRRFGKVIIWIVFRATGLVRCSLNGMWGAWKCLHTFSSLPTIPFQWGRTKPSTATFIGRWNGIHGALSASLLESSIWYQPVGRDISRRRTREEERGGAGKEELFKHRRNKYAF